MNLIVCVDFDGVIHSYTSGWQGVDVIPDPPVPGAIEWLNQQLVAFYDHTSEIQPVIYSSRSKDPKGILAMQDWLLQNGLSPKAFLALAFPTQKPAAFLTIDDRAICFTGTFPTVDEMVNFKPWNKR